MKVAAFVAFSKISDVANALLLSSNEDRAMDGRIFSKANLDLQVGLLLDTTKKSGQNDGKNMANENSALRWGCDTQMSQAMNKKGTVTRKPDAIPL